MRIDLPFCNLKTCRYCFDGNCTEKNRYNGCDYARLKDAEYGIWEPKVNAFGELVEFICDCGHSSTVASNFCPNCGKKIDNSTIEQRINEAIERELN